MCSASLVVLSKSLSINNAYHMMLGMDVFYHGFVKLNRRLQTPILLPKCRRKITLKMYESKQNSLILFG